MGGCADGRAVVIDAAGRVIGVVSPRDISTLMGIADLRSLQPYPLLGADLNAGRAAAGATTRTAPPAPAPAAPVSPPGTG